MSNLVKIIALVFLCLVWGANWVAIKISLEGFPPLLSAAVRFLIAAAVMLIYVKWKRIPMRVNRRDFNYLFFSAFLVYTMDYGLIFWGEQYLSAGVTSIFFSTFSLFTALFSNFVFKNEPFSRRTYTGLFAGFIGILVVFYDQFVSTRFSTIVILASAAIIIAAVSAAAATVIVKKHLVKMNHELLSFHQVWMGALMLLGIALIFESPGHIQLNPRVAWAMIYMGVIASAAAFVVYYRLLQEMSAITLSLIIYVIPLVAVTADYIFLGEVIHLRTVIGMLIIFSGIWLSRGRKAAERQKKKLAAKNAKQRENRGAA